MSLHERPRPDWPAGAIVFTGAYLLAAIGGAIATGNREFLFYIVVMLVLIAAIAVVNARVHLSRTVVWCLSLWGLAHMAGGLVPVPESWPIHGKVRVLYSLWIIPERLKYDQVVHAWGFGVTTFVCWQGLRAIVRAQRPDGQVSPTPGILTLCAAAAMGFGALNEVVEFAATLVVEETNVGDYVNTGWDLVSNAVGAAAAAAWIWLREPRS